MRCFELTRAKEFQIPFVGQNANLPLLIDLDDFDFPVGVLGFRFNGEQRAKHQHRLRGATTGEAGYFAAKLEF